MFSAKKMGFFREIQAHTENRFPLHDDYGALAYGHEAYTGLELSGEKHRATAHVSHSHWPITLAQ